MLGRKRRERVHMKFSIGPYSQFSRAPMTRRLAHDIQVTERDIKWRHLVGN